jgi:site-specific DNA recombinase
LVAEFSRYRTNSERERGQQERRLRKLTGERKKLLDAHYADAIPLDLLKSEQDRIATEAANAEGRLSEIASDFQKAETT